MLGLVPRLSLKWEGLSLIMSSVREEISNDTFALVLVAEEIDMGMAMSPGWCTDDFCSCWWASGILTIKWLLADWLKKKLVRKVQRIETVRLIRHGEPHDSTGSPLGLAPWLSRYEVDILREAICYIQQRDITPIAFKLWAARTLWRLFSAIRSSHT